MVWGFTSRIEPGRQARVRQQWLHLSLLLAGTLVCAVYLMLESGDAPPPDARDLLPPAAPIDVPAASNGWYLIREAVRSMVPPPANQVAAGGGRGSAAFDPAGMRAMLDDNVRALAWIDRAASCPAIMPPADRLSEDLNYLGWSPVSKCGRLLRLRAQWELASGRTNAALEGYAESLHLARLYAACPPARDLDTLAACVEIRNTLLDLRRVSAGLDLRAVWSRFHDDLRDCSDLQVLHARAVAAAFAYDRRNIEELRHWVAGDVAPPPPWDSVFAGLFPGGLGWRQESRLTRATIELFNCLPAGYRLQPNRTLTEMAAIRRGAPLADGRELGRIGMGLFPGGWRQIFGPVFRLLGPNGMGKLYIMSEAGRQRFIDDGIRLAETAARGTRLVLALRMYELEHGTLPDRLEGLVPAWIDALPADPYDARPLRYDRARRLVYAVGVNRRDDGGRRGGGCDDVLFPVSK